MPDCVDCAAAAAATQQGVTVNGSGPPAASSMQVDMGPYTQRGPEYPGQQQGGGAKRERDGVESGYSTLDGVYRRQAKAHMHFPVYYNAESGLYVWHDLFQNEWVCSQVVDGFFHFLSPIYHLSIIYLSFV